MAIFRVYNGWCGNSPIHRIVDAPNKAIAIERARAAWERDAARPRSSLTADRLARDKLEQMWFDAVEVVLNDDGAEIEEQDL